MQLAKEVTAALDQQARLALASPAEQPAIEYHEHWLSWGEISAVANEVGRLLAAGGVAEAIPVAFVPRNRPSAIAAELGMIAGRFTIQMIYAFQSSAGIARDVGRIPVAAVVAAAEDFTPEMLAVVREKGLLAIAIEEMKATAIPGAEHSTVELPDDLTREPQIKVHTSGTTGPPKHVSFSFEMIERYIVGQNINMALADQTPPVLLTFPLGNISGIYSTLPPLLQGRRAILLDRFTLDGWRDFVRRFRPAAPMLPPSGIRMLLDAEIPKEELAHVKMLMTGAAPLDPSVQRAFEDRYGIPILLSYGATEFGGPVTLMTPEDYAAFGAAKTGSVGRPYAGASLRVINQDTGEILPFGEEGLLEVIAPRIGPNWIRTTDIGVIDEDGFLYHRGRSDGAIVRGGFKLLPEAIERALSLHPAVSDVAVVGIPDPRLGQLPVAALQIKLGHEQPSIAELEHHVRQHVYATHVPAAWIFVDTIPRNKSFKTDLAGVRALFEKAA
jgi:long-chain acyl-CoA synthetase